MSARELTAEAAGTFALVLALCGGLVLAPAGIAPLVAAFAAGSVVVAMTGAFGPVTGAHLNPAVTLGLIAAGLAQCLGAVAAAGLLALVIAGANGPPRGGFPSAANAYGGAFGMTAVFAIELAATAILVLVVVGMGGRRAPATVAPIAIGLATVGVYLIAIPISGGGLNPARSLGAALFSGTAAILQLWVFWVAPILGAIVGGVLGRYLLKRPSATII